MVVSSTGTLAATAPIPRLVDAIAVTADEDDDSACADVDGRADVPGCHSSSLVESSESAKMYGLGGNFLAVPALVISSSESDVDESASVDDNFLLPPFNGFALTDGPSLSLSESEPSKLNFTTTLRFVRRILSASVSLSDSDMVH